MKHYYRTLAIVSVSISLLLVLLLAGCRQTCPVSQQQTWQDERGATWVGGCVPMEVRK